MKNYFNPKFAILGAGCGGQTFAGHLGSMGYDVVLHNRSPERLGNLAKDRRITLEGAIKAEGTIRAATTDIEEAVSDADVIMVVTTALGHGDVAKQAAPYLKDGQIMILNPGRTFGSLEAANEIYKVRDIDMTICETNTLLYATRVVEPGRAQVYGVKSEVSIASMHPEKTEMVIKMLENIFPQMQGANNIMETSLGNIGAVFHPTIMLLNHMRILKKESFEFYTEGVNDIVERFMTNLDCERKTIAARLGTQVPSLEEWLSTRYSFNASRLKELLQGNPAYQGIMAPKTFFHRYLLEDVPTGLVPLSLIGKAIGVKTPNMDYLISESERITGIEFSSEGRTLEKLGISEAQVFDDIYSLMYSKQSKMTYSRHEGRGINSRSTGAILAPSMINKRHLMTAK